ncbi:MAG: glycosyltransferase family 9 protein [Planctomycetes bacterium]|nr:glycosyltransferase family 9 protein [Planctomycetota bacterium]
MSELASRDFERILIIKPSSPGDIIHALPILRKLRERYPKAHLAWLVATPFVNLIDADPALEEVIPFDRKRFAQIGRSIGVTTEFIRYVKSLRARRFDLVIDLQGLIRSGFMSWFSGARERIGFRDAREGAWIFYNRRIGRLPADMHAADKLLALGGMLGLSEAKPDFRVAVTQEDRAHADGLLVEAGIGKGQPFAVLVPGTRWETKRWPAERYGELARVLMERHGMPSVLVGAEADFADGELAVGASRVTPRSRKSESFVALASTSDANTSSHSSPSPQPSPFEGEGVGAAARNLCGKTTFRQLAALIDRAAVVVTADSAPMHIAAAHGRPLVALFGPTNPVRTGPYGRLDDVLRLPLECSPCYFRKLSQCPFGQKCMRIWMLEKLETRSADDCRRLQWHDRGIPVRFWQSVNGSNW